MDNVLVPLTVNETLEWLSSLPALRHKYGQYNYISVIYSHRPHRFQCPVPSSPCFKHQRDTLFSSVTCRLVAWHALQLVTYPCLRDMPFSSVTCRLVTWHALQLVTFPCLRHMPFSSVTVAWHTLQLVTFPYLRDMPFSSVTCRLTAWHALQLMTFPYLRDMPFNSVTCPLSVWRVVSHVTTCLRSVVAYLRPRRFKWSLMQHGTLPTSKAVCRQEEKAHK